MRLHGLELNGYFFFTSLNHEGPEGRQLDIFVREVHDQAVAKWLDRAEI